MGGGGAPLRYSYTAGGYSFLQPWNDASCAYSVLQISKGYNPMSKLEVVSFVNLVNLGFQTLWYGAYDSTAKYNPKVYLSTLNAVGKQWLYDRQIYAGSDIKIPENWPINSPQKGETLL